MASRRLKRFLLLFFCLFFWFAGNGLPAEEKSEAKAALAQEPSWQERMDTIPSDTLKKDTLRGPYEPSRRPTFSPRDRYGDPFSNFNPYTPFYLKDPSSYQLDFEIDTAFNYTIYERMGEIDYRAPTELSSEQYRNFQEQRMMQEYWQERSLGLDGDDAMSGRSLVPKLYVSPFFDRLFGGSFVEIIPRGNVMLDFGARWQRIDNPAIPIRQQRNGGFTFDQQISMNVTGKIGEKLAVVANFDNNNTFDFENNLKIEYTGFEEDILQKLEIGNVSLPLNNSLIQGGQNLFGVKAQLQFGKLYVTALASTQRGVAESINIAGGGAQGRPFDIAMSNYDENRHFFLGHFFRDNYERWVSATPSIISGLNVTRVEVYVLNRNNTTETLRNVAAFMDLAEGRRIYRPENPNVGPGNSGSPNQNSANNLFSFLRGLDRNSNSINQTLESSGFSNGLDYERINGARLLSQEEYSVNRDLGFITLTRRLQNDEVLAVAYEYTFNGQAFKVGELSEDYGNVSEENVIFMKMLRPRKISIRDDQNRIIPTWDLMMKNIYNLNATNVSREGFQLRVIYRDDRTGIDNPQLQEGITASSKQLLEIMGLDRLNQNNDPQPDGNFDFVEGLTINSRDGLILFPFLEPLNHPLRREFQIDNNTDFLINKYVFDTLYRSTKADAELQTNLNKYFLEGTVQGGSTNEIMIPGFNIAEGSVRVLAGGVPLLEGSDYQVDYNFGRITILNQGIMASGKDITITYEKADLFNFQTRTLLGTRLDYRVDDDINIGATLLHHNERPLITRVSVGNEPTRNTKYGFDVNIRKESRFLTKMLDALPIFQTKEPSMVTFNAEFAQLRPGTSNIVDGEGTSFIDDFENTITPFSLGNPMSWRLAATPKTSDNRYDPSVGQINDLANGYLRAKSSWYQIDNIFYRSGGGGQRGRPSNISDEDMSNHYVRPVLPQEIFPRQDRDQINVNEPLFEFAFYPTERGMYNYNPNLNINGRLPNPRTAWGGITTAIMTEVDFDKANIEYIEFWLMDPFINSPRGVVRDGSPNPTPNSTGGRLYFNIGNISEDVIRDGRHAFENGLPPDGSAASTETNAWGRVTTQQYLTNAFDNNPQSRENQDVGLDGLDNVAERNQFNDFVEGFAPGSPARDLAEQDPSADDFQFYLGEELDNQDAKVLERYKDFNGMENNSPAFTGGLPYNPSGTTIPDNEDLNRDNTLNENEEYYEYMVNLRPNQLEVGGKYIVDKVTQTINGDEVNWYLYRIPIRNFDNKFGNINDFKSIRYIRMYLTDFAQPVVLRMAKFRFVGSQWRRYLGNLEESRFGPPLEPNPENFTLSVVNIEENSQGNEVQPPYVLPPGFIRDRDNTSTVQRQLNEQAVQICVENLEDSDARAIFKNFNGLDLINYGRIKMFLHANSATTQDDEVTAFIRLGTDFDLNYYEIEIPLKVTPPSANNPRDIWPLENELDLDLNELFALKTARNIAQAPINEIYPRAGPRMVGNQGIRMLGRPDISDIRTIMIGIRNPQSPDGAPKSICVWANELRVTDFDDEAGWAANATLNTKLADFANITASARHTTFGFGGVQSRIAERTREETTSFDVSANINVDKMLPDFLGLQIPMFVSYEETLVKPRFDPLDPDNPLEASILAFETQEERDEYRRLTMAKSVRKSINFTNVRKIKTNPEAKQRIYDVENLSFSYAYSEFVSRDHRIASYFRENHRGSVAYNYSTDLPPIEPFKNVGFLESPYLKLIKEFNFNPLPSSIAVRADVDRRFVRTLYRNEFLQPAGIPLWEKTFNFNRTYNLRWNLTKSLSIDYNAMAIALVDEPDGDLDTSAKRQQVWDNFKNLGRLKNFDQTLGLNYRLPFDKLPITDWFNADYRFEVGYTWTAGPEILPGSNFPDSLDFRHTIQNNRTNNLTGRFDMVKLYNKVTLLKDINQPPRRGRAAPPSRTQQKEEDGDDFAPERKGLKAVLRFLMALRSLNATYTLTEGTLLPGFNITPFLFGMDEDFNAPGFPFLFGSQDPEIRFRAAENGWLVNRTALTTPFRQSQTTELNLRANIEPFNDFKIQLDARRTQMSGYQEIFRFDELMDGFTSLNPNRTGSYSISMITIRTAFIGDDANNNNATFQNFADNRATIANRLNQINPDLPSDGTYGLNSQDVLIPAFIAAYTGQDVNEISLSPFPKTPIPNWRLDYAGLGKIKALSNIFSSVNIVHSYNSAYSVLNYSSSLNYGQGIDLSNNLNDYNETTFGTISNEEGGIIPLYIIQQAMITERFQPLIGINVRTKSQIQARVEYKTERNLGLNISNAQVTELTRNELALEFGFTKSNMKLPIKSNGRTVVLRNQVQFRMNIGIGETKTLQRKIDEVSTITNGNINFQLRPNVNYAINDKLTVQLYFERNINEPLVSNAFTRATTAFGTQLRFNLAQ